MTKRHAREFDEAEKQRAVKKQKSHPVNVFSDQFQTNERKNEEQQTQDAFVKSNENLNSKEQKILMYVKKMNENKSNLNLGKIIFQIKNDILIYKICFEYIDIITLISTLLLICKNTNFNIQNCNLLKQYENHLKCHITKHYCQNFKRLIHGCKMEIERLSKQIPSLSKFNMPRRFNLLQFLSEKIVRRGTFFNRKKTQKKNKCIAILRNYKKKHA